MIGHSLAGCATPQAIENVREPEVVAALNYLTSQVEGVEFLLGTLLKRLEVVSNKDRAVGPSESCMGYSTPLANEICQSATRLDSMQNRLRQQLDALELP